MKKMKDKIKILNKEYRYLLHFLIFLNIIPFLVFFTERNFKTAIIPSIFGISYLIILSLILTSQKILKYFNDKSDMVKYFKRQEIKEYIYGTSAIITIMIYEIYGIKIGLFL